MATTNALSPGKKSNPDSTGPGTPFSHRCLFLAVIVAGIMMFGSIVSWTEEEPTEAAVLDADRPLFVRTFGVSYANVHQLEPILTPLLSGQGSLSVDSRTNCIIVKDTEPAIRSVAQTIVRLDAAMPSHTFHLNYADADAIADKIRRMFGVSARIVEPDQRTHSVNVVANAATLKELRWLVKQWDKPAPQVLIEADILDVSSAKLKELGIEWELRLGYNDEDAVISVGTGRTSTDTPPTGSITFGTPTVVIPAVYDLMGNLITPEQVIPGSDFSAVIEALVEDRSTRTLSRPRILVLDGHAARFEVSTSEPYANTSYSESGAATSLDIQFLDIGIILETTPHITDDGYVVLNIKPEVSTLERDEFFETTVIPDEGGAITNRIRVPVKTQNRAETVVTVRDNHTIAIGGLRTSSDTESVRKVPILGDIPILGIPFRNLNQGKDDRELIIFITPHIVPGDVSSPEARLLRGNESDTAH